MRIFKRSILILLILTTFSLFGVLITLKDVPNINSLRSCVVSSVNSIKLCPENPNYVPLKQISKVLTQAIIISEDAAFFGHDGFDWDELKKSISKNIEKGRFARGGSTITQQLAKNVYLSHEKSLLRKVKEAYLAYKIEQMINKSLILEKYLNVVEFGKDLFGVKAASKYYFNKTPDQINYLEAAFLAYLLPSPIKYSRVFHKKQLTDFSRRRILTITRKLKNFKKITEEEYELAQTQIDSLFISDPPEPPHEPTSDYDNDSERSEDEDLNIIDEHSVDDTTLEEL